MSYSASLRDADAREKSKEARGGDEREEEDAEIDELVDSDDEGVIHISQDDSDDEEGTSLEAMRKNTRRSLYFLGLVNSIE